MFKQHCADLMAAFADGSYTRMNHDRTFHSERRFVGKQRRRQGVHLLCDCHFSRILHPLHHLHSQKKSLQLLRSPACCHSAPIINYHTLFSPRHNFIDMFHAVQLIKNIWNRISNSSTKPSAPPASNAEATSVHPKSATSAAHFTSPILPASSSEEPPDRVPSSTFSPDSAQASHTIFRPPQGDIGPRRVHPLFGANIRATYQPFNKIAMAQPPTFGATASADSGQKSTSSPDVNSFPMTDTPSPWVPTSPTSLPNNASVPGKNAHPPVQNQATVEDDHEEETASSNASSEPSNPNRARLAPKRPQDCHRNSASTSPYIFPDYASQVVWETFSDEDPEPKGYMGTMGGMRWCRSLPEDYSPCGSGGGHYLICGHEVISQEPCGANCKTAQHHIQAFDCSRCRDLAWEILNNKLTEEEQAKVDFFRQSGHPLAIALCVEYISKYLPTRPGNITETVMCILNKNYGRECLAYITVPGENAPKTLVEMFRNSHDRMEEKTREHLARQNIDPLVAHSKRKDVGKEDDAPSGVHIDANVPIDTSDSSDAASSPCESNKKAKAKLETHREPITEDTRGTKRNIPETEVVDSDNADATASGNQSNKKMKQKLRTCHEPITPQTRGTKRNNSFSDSSAPFQATKRMTANAPPKFGEASFMTPPPSVLGPLWRKRDERVHVETALDAESTKRRRRTHDVLPNHDNKAPMNAFRKTRVSLAEMAALGDDEEL